LWAATIIIGVALATAGLVIPSTWDEVADGEIRKGDGDFFRVHGFSVASLTATIRPATTRLEFSSLFMAMAPLKRTKMPSSGWSWILTSWQRRCRWADRSPPPGTDIPLRNVSNGMGLTVGIEKQCAAYRPHQLQRSAGTGDGEHLLHVVDVVDCSDESTGTHSTEFPEVSPNAGGDGGSPGRVAELHANAVVLMFRAEKSIGASAASWICVSASVL
jgi:hypothetical protein